MTAPTDLVVRLNDAAQRTGWLLFFEAAQEIKRMRKPTEWRPMETAPKDGTEVDLWLSCGERVPAAKFNTKRKRWEVRGIDSFDVLDWVDVYSHPVGWLPLPAPPQDGSTS